MLFRCDIYTYCIVMNVNLILNYSSNLYSENKVNIYSSTSLNAIVILSNKSATKFRCSCKTSRGNITSSTVLRYYPKLYTHHVIVSPGQVTSNYFVVFCDFLHLLKIVVLKFKVNPFHSIEKSTVPIEFEHNKSTLLYCLFHRTAAIEFKKH